MKKGLVLGLMTLLIVAAVIIPVSAYNPHTSDGHGQPSQSCQACFPDAPPLYPEGFNTGGFEHAGTVYAGSQAGTGLRSDHSNNPDIAISQYDVACFQQFQRILKQSSL